MTDVKMFHDTPVQKLTKERELIPGEEVYTISTNGAMRLSTYLRMEVVPTRSPDETRTTPVLQTDKGEEVYCFGIVIPARLLAEVAVQELRKMTPVEQWNALCQPHNTHTPSTIFVSYASSEMGRDVKSTTVAWTSRFHAEDLPTLEEVLRRRDSLFQAIINMQYLPLSAE